MIKVLLLNDLSREPARQLVKGISCYRNGMGGWRFYQVPDVIRDSTDHIGKIVSMVRDFGINAIFGQWKGLDVDVAKSLGIPIVLYQRYEEIHDFPIALCDNGAVGKMAAEFFLKYEDLPLAFCGFEGVVWSSARFESFKKAVGGRMAGEIRIRDKENDWLELSGWIRNLPKPAGIFCCNDECAKTVIETCNSIGVKVPDEISVLGVDDDSFLCSITSPAISTVKLDFAGLGYRVGHFITEAVVSGHCEVCEIDHKPLEIIERESTPRRLMDDRYIIAITDYMKQHFSEGIEIKDAIRDIPLSRRAVEQRFANATNGKTMHSFLTELKIGKMKEMLISTDLPVFNIALASGFKENSNVNRIFRSITGLSPKEFRRIHK